MNETGYKFDSDRGARLVEDVVAYNPNLAVNENCYVEGDELRVACRRYVSAPTDEIANYRLRKLREKLEQCGFDDVSSRLIRELKLDRKAVSRPKLTRKAGDKLRQLYQEAVETPLDSVAGSKAALMTHYLERFGLPSKPAIDSLHAKRNTRKEIDKFLMEVDKQARGEELLQKALYDMCKQAGRNLDEERHKPVED